MFDWEHLAHLHEASFADCKLLDKGAWGWRVALTPSGGAAQEIEMQADRTTGHYTSTTIEGNGRGSEIRVALAPVNTEIVDVTVEFHLPESRPGPLAALGEAYTAVYARLWDEDEAMMQARKRALSQRLAPKPGTAALDLGEEYDVREALPIAFDFGGAPFRLIELDGDLVVHAAICPHWLGPLNAAPVVDGAVRCPWHGYRFDVVSRAGAEHPELRLAPAPAIRIVDGRIVAEQA